MELTPSIASCSSESYNNLHTQHASTCDTSYDYNTIFISEENNTMTSIANAQPLLYTVSNQEISNTCNTCNTVHIMDIEPLTSCDNSHINNVITDKKHEIAVPSSIHFEASNTFKSNTFAPSDTYEPSNSSEMSKMSSPQEHCTQNFSTLFSWTS